MRGFFLLLFCGCSSVMRTPSVSVVRLVGSDTMLYLSQCWAERFMVSRTDSRIVVQIEGGGSSRGIQLFIEGKSDICASSRPLSSGEVQQLATRYGSVGLAHRVGLDALSVFVHPSNLVTDLTLDQIGRIFKGDIQNWKEVGGPSAPIQVMSRNTTSGTYFYFRDHVLEGAPYSVRAEQVATTEELIQRIAEDSLAIGYGGLGYGNERVRSVKVNGIAATEENVRRDQYPIRRYLVFYTLQFPSGAVKQFIDWVVSEQGQSCVRDVGFIPLFHSDR